MVYKKYIKRGDKLFGPYYYKSVKKEGKVITQYVKNPDDFPQKKLSIGSKKINKNLLILPIVFLILIAGFFILKPVLTGKVIMSVDTFYVFQETLFGELKLNLESGEFIPADTKVLINNEEFILRNLIKEAPKPGEFYISGTEISGKGEGYGSGNSEVSFVLNVLSEKKQDKENENTETERNNEINEAGEEIKTSENEVQTNGTEIEDEISEISGEQQTELQNSKSTIEEQIPAETTETSLSEEIPEVSSTESEITGATIFNFFSKIFLTITGKTALKNVNEIVNEIQGEVSKDKPFIYALEQDQTAEISPKEGDKKNSNKKINLEIINNTATITTDYSGEEAEYLINLSELNIPVSQKDLEIKLIYNKTEFYLLNKNLNIEKVNPAENLTENLTEEAIQHTAIAGKPVKWTKKIIINNSETIVKLPKEAENISVYKLENSPAMPDNLITGNLILKYEKEKSGIFNRLFAFITGRAVEIIENREEIEVNISETASDYEVEYFTPGPEITEKNTSAGKEIIISSDVHYENILAYTTLPENTDLEEIKLYQIVNGSKVLVDFIAYNKNNNIIESEGDLDDDVLAEIENKVLKKEENEILENTLKGINKSLDKPYRNIIYGEEHEDNLNYSVKRIRAEKKDSVSRIEWIVPSLSSQTYELILITKAQHLDSNRNFISDIYDEVKALDNNWSEQINDSEYVRITFEKNLTKENDITIYAKAGCNNTIRIENIEVPCDIYYKKLLLDSLRGENG